MTLGVTIAICTHNGQFRLPTTLEYVAIQKTHGIPVELLIVDNASTDQTRGVAQDVWNKIGTFAMRCVREERLGLTHARDRAIRDAVHELVLFVDDDNWLGADYVSIAHQLHSDNPRLGACGGQARPVFECTPPEWFSDFQHFYAVGAQSSESGDVKKGQGFLWGAGTCVRKQAIRSIEAAGFRPMLSDRKGTSLSSAGDVELSLALRLAGWLLWFDSRLSLSHYQPANRLTWEYLRRLSYCNGVAAPILGLYQLHLEGCPWHNRVFGANWSARTLIAWVNIARASVRYITSRRSRNTQLEFLRRRGVFVVSSPIAVNTSTRRHR